MMLLAAALGAALSLQPVPASADDGLEAVAAQYFAPPTSVEVQTVLGEAALQNAGIVGLARAIGAVEEALAQCKALRYQMTALIGDTYGSYSVHPDWVKGYRNCLTTRHDEVKRLKTAIDTRQRSLVGSNEGEAALRAADVISRLQVYQIDLKKAVEREFEVQKAFVQYYNTGELPEALTAEDGGPVIGDPGGE